MESLWPEFKAMKPAATPGTVLKEQAQALGRQFNNRIQGEIGVSRDQERFKYVFNLRCSPLGYRYKLFEAVYGLIDLYPVSIIVEGDIARELCDTTEVAEIKAPNEEELKAILRRIFTTQKTQNLILALHQHLE